MAIKKGTISDLSRGDKFNKFLSSFHPSSRPEFCPAPALALVDSWRCSLEMKLLNTANEILMAAINLPLVSTFALHYGRGSESSSRCLLCALSKDSLNK